MEATVRIDALTYGTSGIGRLADGKAVFVDDTAPGDLVRVEITHEKASFANAALLEVLEDGPQRVKPFCAACTACGGCPWAHLSYQAQLDAKRDNLVSCLTRIAHLEPEAVEHLVAECVPSKRQTGYRNKLELGAHTTRDGQLAIGFHREKSHRLATPDTCPIVYPALQKAPKALRGALRYAQGKSDLGLFRVGARASVRTRDLEVALWTTPGKFPRAMVSKILNDALHPTSIIRIISEDDKRRRVKSVEVLNGKGCWEETLADARFKVSAPSFFQVNTAQAEQLVEIVIDRLALGADAQVADLYSGVGTFTIPLARRAGWVAAVESSGSAVRDLRRNAEINGVDIEVIGGDSARELPELGELDALVVDPPRSGLADGVPDSIAAVKPARVAYVSCNPSTLARDVARFAEVGYTLTEAVPVDLFPQTYHAETVALLARR